MKKNYWAVFVPAILSLNAFAFSPYENYLLSGKPTHVGLIARAKSGQDERLSQQLYELCGQKAKGKLKRAGISNPSAFIKEKSKVRHGLSCISNTPEKKQYLTAAQSFEAATAELKDVILPHPRAQRYGCCWLQMEWINFIRGLDVERQPTEVLSMVTTIKPEQESNYRKSASNRLARGCRPDDSGK